MKRVFVAIIPILLFVGCAINQAIVPLANNLDIQKIYIVKNFDGRFDPALEIIKNKLIEKNIEYKIVNGTPPPDGEFHLDYGGEFTWDFRTYMSKFVVNVYQNGRVIAGAEYNAKSGGFRIDKFANTEQKITSIINECFYNL